MRDSSNAKNDQESRPFVVLHLNRWTTRPTAIVVCDERESHYIRDTHFMHTRYCKGEKCSAHLASYVVMIPPTSTSATDWCKVAKVV